MDTSVEAGSLQVRVFFFLSVLNVLKDPVHPAHNVSNQQYTSYQTQTAVNTVQLLFLLLHHSVKSSWLHCECRGCWETDDVFSRHSGVTTCPVRIRVSRKVPKTGSEVLVLLEARPPVCCSPPVTLWFHVWRHLGTNDQSEACPLH